ncbi:hypothetical protein F0L68_21540 [Solihabitans fulvus]|uniref:Uncharacterized protein n=1 Tax=Solihabitans fulvus TaxID=1892852 RepID=A0A5B2X8N3_9PSEU|nr:DUF6082 family protein [Solihabitans fulvus]KAA2259513.1 hypothetical protein F0L68_21540 [Solihabitans fulvus]
MVPLLVLLALGVVVASPLALRALDDGSHVDWARLSNIGQTYGAVSAMIAVIALSGVAASLVIQNREAKAARKSALRGLHTDLMRMALDEPLYMDCLGPYLTPSFDTERQHTYVNLLVAHWYAAYEIGETTEAELRASALGVFTGMPGRRFWQSARDFWATAYPDRRSLRFFHILDEAYLEAVQRPAVPGEPGLGHRTVRPPHPVVERRWLACLAAAGCGAAAPIALLAARRALRSRRARRSTPRARQ